MTERGRVLSALIAEIVFAILPLIVVLMVAVQFGRASSWFASSEWAFGAAILFGQSLAKFVVGLTRGDRAAGGPVALAVALLIVFGIAPALILLVMNLIAFEGGGGPEEWLQMAQVSAFVLASVAYLVFGTVGELWGRSS